MRARRAGCDDPAMEALLKSVAELVALGCELIAIGMLGVGAVEVLVGLAMRIGRWWDPSAKRKVWLRFAAWILLSLELTLAADIVRTVIAPTWSQIGQLAAIALIRTFLNLFLERDVEALSAAPATARAPPGHPAPK